MANKPKKQRVPCPFCRELIIKGAKKCRFCGEMLNSLEEKSKKTGFLRSKISLKVFYRIWLLSCVVFILALGIITSGKAYEYSDHFLTALISFLVLAVIIGGTTFLGLVLAILSSLKQKQSRWYGAVTAGTLLVFFLIFFSQSAQSNQSNQNYLQDPLGPVEVIKAVNQEREIEGLSQLNNNSKLSSAAKNYAQDMCNNNYYISETDDYSKKYIGFIDNADYEYQLAAFTVNEGVCDTQELIRQWLQNKETKEAMLSEQYSDTGVGIVRCGMQVLGQTTDIIVQFYAIPKETGAAIQQTPSKVQKSAPQVNTESPNDPVHCPIHENCGGGSKPLTRQECDNTICCEYEQHKWKLMDETECKNLHKSYEEVIKRANERVPVIGEGGRILYCDENATDAIKSAVEKIKEEIEIMSECLANTNYDYDFCSLIVDFAYDQYWALTDRHCN